MATKTRAIRSADLITMNYGNYEKQDFRVRATFQRAPINNLWSDGGGDFSRATNHEYRRISPASVLRLAIAIAKMNAPKGATL